MSLEFTSPYPYGGTSFTIVMFAWLLCFFGGIIILMYMVGFCFEKQLQAITPEVGKARKSVDRIKVALSRIPLWVVGVLCTALIGAFFIRKNLAKGNYSSVESRRKAIENEARIRRFIGFFIFMTGSITASEDFMFIAKEIASIYNMSGTYDNIFKDGFALLDEMYPIDNYTGQSDPKPLMNLTVDDLNDDLNIMDDSSSDEEDYKEDSPSPPPEGRIQNGILAPAPPPSPRDKPWYKRFYENYIARYGNREYPHLFISSEEARRRVQRLRGDKPRSIGYYINQDGLRVYTGFNVFKRLYYNIRDMVVFSVTYTWHSFKIACITAYVRFKGLDFVDKAALTVFIVATTIAAIKLYRENYTPEDKKKKKKKQQAWHNKKSGRYYKYDESVDTWKEIDREEYESSNYDWIDLDYNRRKQSKFQHNSESYQPEHRRLDHAIVTVPHLYLIDSVMSQSQSGPVIEQTTAYPMSNCIIVSRHGLATSSSSTVIVDSKRVPIDLKAKKTPIYDIMLVKAPSGVKMNPNRGFRKPLEGETITLHWTTPEGHKYSIGHVSKPNVIGVNTEQIVTYGFTGSSLDGACGGIYIAASDGKIVGFHGIGVNKQSADVRFYPADSDWQNLLSKSAQGFISDVDLGADKTGSKDHLNELINCKPDEKHTQKAFQQHNVAEDKITDIPSLPSLEKGETMELNQLTMGFAQMLTVAIKNAVESTTPKKKEEKDCSIEKKKGVCYNPKCHFHHKQKDRKILTDDEWQKIKATFKKPKVSKQDNNSKAIAEAVVAALQKLNVSSSSSSKDEVKDVDFLTGSGQ